MPPLRIHALKCHRDDAPKPLDVTWEELVAELTTRPTGPVFAADVTDKKSATAQTIPAWIPASLKILKRGSAFVESVTVLVLDYDKQHVTEWDRARKNLEGAGVAYAFHSTRSHRPVDGALCYRMIIPLSRPFSEVKAWSQFYEYVVGKFAASITRTDGSTKDPGRLFYVPILVEGGAEFESGYHPGEPLDVDAVLDDMRATGTQLRTDANTALGALLKGDHALLVGWEKHGYETLKALLHADPDAPYAQPGHRDKALFACATWIAPRIYRKCTPEDIVQACAKGLALEGSRHSDGHTFLLKLERAWAEAQRVTDSTADPVTQCQLGRDGPYSDEEIMTYVQEQRLPSAAHLARQVIIQHQMSYYVFSQGDYVYAGTRQTGETLIRQKLATADSLGVAVKTINPKTGLPQNVKYADLLDGHRAAVRKVTPSLSIKTSYVDWRTDTLMHCCCPRRLDLQPIEDEDITRWLRSWGDETLLDWLATSARLDKATAALYLSGPPKGGKTMLARGLSTIWGGPPTEMESIGENFNGELTENPVVLADESLPERFRKDSGLLRRLITAESITLNRKYMAPTKLQGSFRIIMARNNLNLFGQESMTREDVDAVAERILYYHVPARAPYFHPVRLANHILWMERTRCEFAAAKSKDRLWVEGRDSELHRHLRISSKDRSLVCQFVMELLLNPAPIKHASRRELDLRRRVAISPRLIYNQWQTYLGKERQLSLNQVARVLGELGVKGVDELGLYEINLEDLRQYAQAHSYPRTIEDLIDDAYAKLNSAPHGAGAATN
jgi:hypothetical protein